MHSVYGLSAMREARIRASGTSGTETGFPNCHHSPKLRAQARTKAGSASMRDGIGGPPVASMGAGYISPPAGPAMEIGLYRLRLRRRDGHTFSRRALVPIFR